METTPETRAGGPSASGPSTTISISAIERELSALWQTAPGDEERVLATRTSVLNLVVYAEGDEAAARAADTVAQLAGSHPSRAIIVAAYPRHDTASLDTTLSAHCHIASSGHGKFCCEQVTIEATGEAVEHVAGVVAPLLLPDLPTVLWWQGVPPLDSRPFQRLVEIADRLIVDVEQFGYGQAALLQVQKVRQALGAHCALADLAWTRLRPWRELIASLFDPPSIRPFVRHLESLRIEYVAPSKDPLPVEAEQRTPPAILLLVAWIESATDLQLKVTLQPKKAPDQAMLGGDVLVFETEAAVNGHQLHAVLRRSAHESSVVIGETVEVDGIAREERRHTFAASADSGWLARELEAHGSDLVYEAAVDNAARRGEE